MSRPAALFVIDPPQRLVPATDTSLALMRTGLARGFRVFYCTLSDLRLDLERPWARVRPVTFSPGAEMFRAGSETDLDLSTVALLFMRKDPPVDAAYLQACAILDRLPPTVLQVNPSRALRLHGEKMIPAYFPGLQPPTVVSADPAVILDFLARAGRLVIKPLEECSGRGIFLLTPDDPEGRDRLRTATADGRRFVQAQLFLPGIAGGDKRVLLLGGEILGWIRRVPAAGEFRSNINAGGTCVPCDLEEADRAICDRLRPWLVREEIHLAGIDIVDGRVLEVNITSPSCLREINALTGAALEEKVFDYLCGRRPSPGPS